MLQVACPCGKNGTIPDAYAGKSIRCKTCCQRFTATPIAVAVEVAVVPSLPFRPSNKAILTTICVIFAFLIFISASRSVVETFGLTHQAQAMKWFKQNLPDPSSITVVSEHFSEDQETLRISVRTKNKFGAFAIAKGVFFFSQGEFKAGQYYFED